MNFIIHLFKSLILFIRRRRNWKRGRFFSFPGGSVGSVREIAEALGLSQRDAYSLFPEDDEYDASTFLPFSESPEEYAANIHRMLNSRFAWNHKPAFEPGGYFHDGPRNLREFSKLLFLDWKESYQKRQIHMRLADIYARMITAENLDLHCLKISLIAEDAKLYLHSAINPEAIADRAVRKARAEDRIRMLARKGWIVTPEEVVPEFDRLRRRASFGAGIGLQTKMPPPTFEI